ncbi:MAG: 8-oxo-dGTP diphosphatase [Oscillospiraceae bacterium]|nr:8-oxo-dGTP diphosphatase [Oscillospiraceae bacterium]
MQLTTLCYLERDGQYLMLHRISKENDPNKDKWIGVGGKFEEDESPEECVLRETKEETGLDLIAPRYRGVVTFVCPPWPSEQMHLFTADRFTGEMTACTEGVLEWVKKDRVRALPLWEGDKLFLDLLAADAPFFSLKLVYADGVLARAVLNGEPIAQTGSSR